MPQRSLVPLVSVEVTTAGYPKNDMPQDLNVAQCRRAELHASALIGLRLVDRPPSPLGAQALPVPLWWGRGELRLDSSWTDNCTSTRAVSKGVAGIATVS